MRYTRFSLFYCENSIKLHLYRKNLGHLSDAPHPCGLYGFVSEFQLLSHSLCVRACLFLFFLSFEWHKFSISIQLFSKKKSILLDFPIVCLSLGVTGYHLYDWKTVSAVSVYKAKKTKETLKGKMLLWSEEWSSWFPSYHAADESHLLKRHISRSAYTGIKVVHEIFTTVLSTDSGYCVMKSRVILHQCLFISNHLTVL